MGMIHRRRSVSVSKAGECCGARVHGQSTKGRTSACFQSLACLVQVTSAQLLLLKSNLLWRLYILHIPNSRSFVSFKLVATGLLIYTEEHSSKLVHASSGCLTFLEPSWILHRPVGHHVHLMSLLPRRPDFFH